MASIINAQVKVGERCEPTADLGAFGLTRL